MSSVTPGWKFVAIGVDATPVDIRGIDVWRQPSGWLRFGVLLPRCIL